MGSSYSTQIIIYVIIKLNVIYTGTESWQFSWIYIIVELRSGSGFVWLSTEIWIYFVYVTAVWRMVVIIKQKTVSLYSNTKENDFIIFCIWLSFIKHSFFLVLAIYSWISKKIFKQWMLYLCLYLGILYDFLLKLWIFIYDFFRAMIQNVSTKKTVSTTKKGFYFARSYIMLPAVCW